MALTLPKLNKNASGEDIDQPFSNEVDGADVEAQSPSSSSNRSTRKKKKMKKKDKNKRDDSLFPTPKQVVTIYSPILHVITQETDPKTGAVSQSPSSPHQSIMSRYVEGVWKGYTASAPAQQQSSAAEGASGSQLKPPRPKIRRIKVKMGSLIIKMLNRLVRENVVGYDRIFISRNATHMMVRILASERTVPILLMRCERIGVGSVVGAAFSTGLEWSMVPSITDEMQTRAATEQPFDLDKVLPAGTSEENLVGADKMKVTIDREVIVDNDEEEDAEEVSISSDDEDEEDLTGEAIQQSGSNDIREDNEVLSKERKAKLGQVRESTKFVCAPVPSILIGILLCTAI